MCAFSTHHLLFSLISSHVFLTTQQKTNTLAPAPGLKTSATATMSSSNQNVGRDELAAMLGASYASDLIVAAGTSASDLAKKSLLPGGGVTVSGSGRKHYAKGAGGGEEEDVSKMDRAQAAALVARKFAGGGSGISGTTAGGGLGTMGATRHRASGKRKRLLQHHLLVGDLIDNQDMTLDGAENVANLYVNEDRVNEEEEESFALRQADGARKKSEAKVLVRKTEAERNRRRGSSSSSGSVSSSSDSSSSVSSSHQRSRSRHRSGERRNGRSRSNSSSSSEDEADIRRRKARERAQKDQESRAAHKAGETAAVANKLEQESREQANDFGENCLRTDDVRKQKEDALLSTNIKDDRDRRPRLEGSSSSSDRSLSSSVNSSTSSDDSSTSSDESDHNAALPMSISKPLFVPKYKRGTVTEVELQTQKQEEAEKRRAQEAEKRAIQSRALVAAVVSSAGKAGGMSNIEGDEFDSGEVGGEFVPVPDDTDPNEEDAPELVAAERDAWEVRELVRILRDFDEVLEREKERKELERRRALTDEERLEEDRLTGKYRAPGEARRRLRDDANTSGKGSRDGRSEESNRYLQRFHHRGAFYMDEDTLNQAGADDVRHRAAVYSRAATGEDKIDKSALPKVMQVKKFGFAGYSTKYKGLAKEDTTDKNIDFLPIRGKGRDR